MKIDINTVVSFHYDLRDGNDRPLESTRNDHPSLYLHGHRNILPALEQAFAGKEPGDSFSLELTPEQGYGPYNPAGKQRVPLKRLAPKGEKLRVGQLLRVQTDNGPKQLIITKLGKFNADVDMNHPMAGKTLKFDIEVVDVRDATGEELVHKHAHGPGGHHH